MISIEITEIYDESLLGQRSVNKNEFSIGPRCLLPLNLKKTYSFIVNEDKLYFESHKNPYLLNKKKALSKRKLKKDDLVTVEDITFKVIEFSSTQTPSDRELVNDSVQKIIQEKDKALDSLVAIQKRMQDG